MSLFKLGLASGLLKNLAKSFVDNVIRDCVYPIKGSVVYCDLAFGNAEHSGIYIGNDEIVHLDGSGDIEIVTPKVFLARLGGFNSAISIYVSCSDSLAVGGNTIAKRAKEMAGKRRNYNLIFDNCHQFTSGCITGNFENSDNFLWMLKHTAENEINANTWRVWETTDGEYV
jgi:hypothetical protein